MQYQKIRRTSALALAAAGLLWLMASMAWGTLQGASEAAGESAGTAAGMAALAASLILYLAGKLSRPRKTLAWAAMTALHAGLLLIACLLGNALFGEKGFVYSREGDAASFEVDKAQQEHPLPFAVRLKSFHADVYPGTMKPQAFTSDVVFEQDGAASPARIAVNSSASHDGYSFYQQSYATEVSGISRLPLTVTRRDGTQSAAVLAPGATAEIAGCGRLRLLDFVPSAQMQDGRLMVLSDALMLSPAYRLLSDFTGRTLPHWVLAKAPETERIGPCQVHPGDFQGVRYTVLSVVRAPLDGMILLGAALAAAGAAAAMARRRK